jgi:septal ring factor EnvC (AmiA/AmiB activator)
MKQTIAEQLKLATESLTQINAELATVKAERDQAAQEAADLKAKLTQLQTNFDAVCEKHEGIALDNVELNYKVNDLTAQLEAATKSAHQKAADIVASIGVPAVESTPTISQQTKEGLWEQYRELQKSDPREATRFYRKHQTQMDR